MGSRTGAAVPRPRARQGARHPPAHAVAPGPAVLQRRRPPERQHVVPGRPGAADVDAASSSPARTAASGSCRGRSSTTRPSGSPTARSPSCPTIDGRPERLPRSSAGSSSRATPCSSTCSRCTPPAASPGRTAGGCCRCASSATTSSTRRGRGRRRRRSPASTTSCRPARRWTTRCSPSCGRRRRPVRHVAGMDEPIDYVELPGGDLPATKEFYASRASAGAFTDYGPEYALDRTGAGARRRRSSHDDAGRRPPPLIDPQVRSTSRPTLGQRSRLAGADDRRRRSSSFPGGRPLPLPTTPPATCLGVWSRSDRSRASSRSATRCCANGPGS